MKVGTRYNSRNYAGAYYAQAKKKTGNASAPLLRLREVVHEEEAETRDARKGDRQEVTEPGDVNGIDNQQCLSFSLLLLLSRSQFLRRLPATNFSRTAEIQARAAVFPFADSRASGDRCALREFARISTQASTIAVYATIITAISYYVTGRFRRSR